MFDLRWRSLLRLFLIGVLTAAPLACAQVLTSKVQVVVASANAMCPVGSEGCDCTGGGGCDPGLYCDNGTCVGDSYGGDEEYMFEDEVAPEPSAYTERSLSIEPPRSRPSRKERRARHKSARGDKNFAEAEYAAPAESAAEPQPVDQSTPTANETPRDPADELDNARQVIYTATLQVAVFDLDAAAELAESLPQRYGGWIESRFDYQFTLRIRAEHLFDAIEELGTLGIVLDRTLLAEDVTAEYIDLDSRIRVLEELVKQLEALLARATSVEQALQIRVELDRVRIELEAARVRMRQLAELIDFSTLTVRFSPRSPIDMLPSSNDPFPWVDDLGVEWTEYR